MHFFGPTSLSFRMVFPGFLLFVLVFALFAPSLGYELVQADDTAYIVNNALVRNGLTPEGIRAAFSPANAAAPMYMPLLWISYMADVSLFRASPSHPWGFHFTNVLLHAVNALLLYGLLLALCKRPWSAFFCAVLWAIHPLRVESVAWVAERKDVLSGFFCLLTVAFYAQANRPPARWRPVPYLAALGAFSAGLLTKPALVPLPLALLCLDIWPLGRMSSGPRLRRAFHLTLEKTPFILVAAAVAGMTILGHRNVGALDPAPLWRHALLVPIHYGFYLFKICWPAQLGPLYPLIAFSWMRFIAAGILLAVFSFWAWRIRSSRPQIGIGWLWFLLLFLPIIGFFGPVGVHSVADRFTYLPALGLSLALLPTGAPRAASPRQRAGLALVAVGLLVALAALTLTLLPHWATSEQLFARVAALTPDHPATRNVQILRQLARDGDFATAQAELERAFAAAPQDVEILSSLTLCIHAQQGPDAALAFLENQRPTAEPLVGEWALQMAQYSFLGARYDETIAYAEQARLHLAPTDVGQNNLSLLEMAAAFEKGDAAAALDYAQRLPPYRNRDRIELADLLPLHSYHWQLGLRRDAWAYFQRLIESSPDRGDLLNNIAWLLATAEWSPVAPRQTLEWAKRAQALAPGPHPALLDTLAAAQANAGDFDAAAQTIRQALELVPNIPATDTFRRNLQTRLKLYQNKIPYREEAADRLWQNQ
jgi:tetratricopeptide (TPR) repeat protein